MRRLSSILLWSVIAAAFIGPGTVTTAAAAGGSHGLALLWALVFSTGACLVLQEAGGRLTVVSGRSLGQALRDRYSHAIRGTLVLSLALGAILLGCAAYEAGNILGGVAGAMLVIEWPAKWMALLSGGVAFFLLWSQAPRTVARLLSIAVAVMGLAFLVTAWKLGPPVIDLLRGSLVPNFPPGAGVLVLGLVGTTVVPYNLFLGSVLARGENLGDMRLGLTVAIGFGGLISVAVLVVGTAVVGVFSYDNLASVLEQSLGRWARTLFGLGLMGAGLSSAITAPLAAAITARDLLGREDGLARWDRRSWRYRVVWGGVLLTGLTFGLSDVRPIPAIILAQALNGLLLPLVAVFLWVAVNDPALMKNRVNGNLANLLMGVVVLVSLLLGIGAIWRAGARALGGAAPEPIAVVLISAAVGLIILIPVLRKVILRRS